MRCNDKGNVKGKPVRLVVDLEIIANRKTVDRVIVYNLDKSPRGIKKVDALKEFVLDTITSNLEYYDIPYMKATVKEAEYEGKASQANSETGDHCRQGTNKQGT